MHNNKNSADSAILLVHCDDRPGLVASVTRFIQQYGGNILDLDQHTDKQNKKFFMRVAWELAGFSLAKNEIGDRFGAEVAQKFSMQFRLLLSGQKLRMAVFVSQMFHCLYDILARHQAGEWEVEIPLIVSNHPDVVPVARQFGIESHVIPITPQNKARQEQAQLELLKSHAVDFIVLARYMQILSASFIEQYPDRIINIHHSFLPAFPGARPYQSAHARGVKVIGATSHYVTSELDAGPIIAQDIVQVSHKDSVEDLVRKGRDLEKLVLARAVWHHLQHRILVYDNKTVVFS
jgi:formyltetrahydrofolate deformylase